MLEKDKFYKLITIISIILIISTYCLLLFPSKVNKSFTGIRYKLLSSDTIDIKEVTINVDGKIVKNLFLENKKFVGTINIEGIDDLLLTRYKPEEYKELFNSKIELPLDNNFPIELRYYIFKSNEYGGGIGYENKIGWIFFCSKFDNISVYIPSPLDEMYGKRDPIILSAPASNKEEAIAISDKLIKYSNIPQKLVDSTIVDRTIHKVFKYIYDDEGATKLIGSFYQTGFGYSSDDSPLQIFVQGRDKTFMITAYFNQVGEPEKITISESIDYSVDERPIYTINIEH